MKVIFWAELIGTSFLVMIVLGSGTMAQNLFPTQPGAALLANSLATGAGLFALIQTLGSLSGAHLNPVVSFVECLWNRINKLELLVYVIAQVMGAYLGVLFVHLMFNLPVFVISTVERSGANLILSELIATFGLIMVIALSGKKHVEAAPMSVAAYITAGYWFTSSTAFTNPAVTFARMFTNTFGGMSPTHFVPFVVAQIIGALFAWYLLKLISPLDK
ncbi:MAG: aquaporin [Bdellovibrionales bacterium]|nr:aquaporin [Bdellovibrionales bacterium]